MIEKRKKKREKEKPPRDLEAETPHLRSASIVCVHTRACTCVCVWEGGYKPLGDSDLHLPPISL